MLRDISLDQVRAHIAPYLVQELERVAAIALRQKVGAQAFANGEVLPFRDLSEWGTFDPMTKTIKVKKTSPVGIFQGHHCWSSGTNTMQSITQVMNIPVRSITGDVVICYEDIQRIYDSVVRNDPNGEMLEAGEIAPLRLLSPDDANPLIMGYRNYIETYGYNGDLSLGINGLASIPSSSFTFTTPWAAQAGDVLFSSIIEPITAATVANCSVDFKRILLPTAPYNTIMSKVLPGTSQTVWKALTDLGYEVVKVCGLDSAFNGVPTALYLPETSDESLFYGNMGSLLIDFFNEGDSIVARGYAHVAGAISTNSGNMLRATGM